MKLYQAFLWMMIGSLTLAAVLGVWALIMPGFGWVQQQVLFTALFVGLFSLPAFGCAIVLHRRRDRPVMWIGIVSAAIAMTLALIMLWLERTAWIPDEVIQTMASFSIVTVWAAHFGLLRLTKLQGRWARAVRLISIVLAMILAAIFLLAVWEEPRIEWFWRVIGVLFILLLCSTIVTPILVLIELISVRSGRESLPSSLKVSLICPRCGSGEQMNIGMAKCSSCGLRIAIDVEEPRCSCGYLLHKLQGENCPECGRAIPEVERWHVTKTVTEDDPPAAEKADRPSGAA